MQVVCDRYITASWMLVGLTFQPTLSYSLLTASASPVHLPVSNARSPNNSIIPAPTHRRSSAEDLITSAACLLLTKPRIVRQQTRPILPTRPQTPPHACWNECYPTMDRHATRPHRSSLPLLSSGRSIQTPLAGSFPNPALPVQSWWYPPASVPLGRVGLGIMLRPARQPRTEDSRQTSTHISWGQRKESTRMLMSWCFRPWRGKPELDQTDLSHPTPARSRLSRTHPTTGHPWRASCHQCFSSPHTHPRQEYSSHLHSHRKPTRVVGVPLYQDIRSWPKAGPRHRLAIYKPLCPLVVSYHAERSSQSCPRATIACRQRLQARTHGIQLLRHSDKQSGCKKQSRAEISGDPKATVKRARMKKRRRRWYHTAREFGWGHGIQEDKWAQVPVVSPTGLT